MDLDFHLDDADKPAPMRAPREPEPELAAAHAEAPASTADRLARPAAAMELDKLDLSFDPDKATFEDPTPSVLDGQWHDAATKLDLAKAYQEMGDVEGAREILQEVLHEGDEQQRTEAQAILTKLG
jgi:pilus assembly protein FimV